jgi:hypothetical protein
MRCYQYCWRCRTGTKPFDFVHVSLTHSHTLSNDSFVTCSLCTAVSEHSHFFSYTAARGEVSLVLDDRWIPLFTAASDAAANTSTPTPAATSAPALSASATDTKSSPTPTAASVSASAPTALRLHASRWTSLMVLDGVSGYNPLKVSQLSRELSRESISIYYLSSYDTDFVLVGLPLALVCALCVAVRRVALMWCWCWGRGVQVLGKDLDKGLKVLERTSSIRVDPMPPAEQE